MRQIRALFFLNSFAGGGAERVCLNLARQLHELGIESDFITIFDHKKDYDVPEYIQIFSLGQSDPFLTRFSIVKWVPRVNRFISGKEYILMTAHLELSQYLASLTKVRDKVLYVMHVTQRLRDTGSSGLYKIKLRFFLRGKEIITVSKGLKNELVNEYGIDEKRITTIYNPCAKKILRTGLKAPSPNMRPYILVMGRLEAQKNPLMALELYYKGRFYDKYDLIFLGNGTLETDLRQKIADYDLEGFVFLRGFQKKPEQWLMNASLLLSCSRQEGFAMNLAEALICETPVVAADCPYGPNEILVGQLAEYLIYPEQKFDESISVISSALREYPEITEKYYKKFDDALCTRKYLETWKKMT